VADPATIDPRFLVDEQGSTLIASVIDRHWPAQIHSEEIQDPGLIAGAENARAKLLEALDLAELA
jgi:succinylarginine dihydrolase